MRISANRLRKQLDEVFTSWGMIEPYRNICVKQIIEADLMGIDSHGIGMLPLYEQYRMQGRLIVIPK